MQQSLTKNPAPARRDTGKDATLKLARHAASLRFEALPHELVDRTKQCVLDTIGVTLGASTLAPEGSLVVDYGNEMGGRPECTVFGFGGSLPAPWAAFVNGSLSHMLDFDGIGNGGHVNSATVPVALTMADKSGSVSGRDLITAIAVGADLHVRIDQSIGVAQWETTEGWLATQLLGYLSGTAAAGRVLRLTEEQMVNALGIAFNQMSGSRQMAVGTATHMRAMQAGFAGLGAAQAALLAQRDIIGSKEIIEGRYGLFKTYVRHDNVDWEALLGGLGTRFPFLGTYAHGFKVWPACHYTSSTNTSVLHLRDQHNLKPQDIESITIIGGSGATPMLFEPIAVKRRPQTSIDGKYSLPFTTAAMMLRGTVTLRDYTAEGLRDPDVLALAERVHYRPQPEHEAESDRRSALAAKGELRHGSQMSRPTVEIKTKNGEVFSHRAENVPGDGKMPVTWDFLESKFRECASFSAKPVAAADLNRAMEMIRDLENVADVRSVVKLFA